MTCYIRKDVLIGKEIKIQSMGFARILLTNLCKLKASEQFPDFYSVIVSKANRAIFFSKCDLGFNRKLRKKVDSITITNKYRTCFLKKMCYLTKKLK